MAVAEQTLAPTEAKADTPSEKRPARMLIDGAWVDSLSGAFLSVENPAKRCPVGEVPRGDAADVNGAVEAAARAFPAWSKVAPRDRGRLLLRHRRHPGDTQRGTGPHHCIGDRERIANSGAA
jgi:delta 1-pyrroline-5-carboxylate dehydrogenase